MANITAIGNDLLVYRAFAALANAAPGSAAFNAHRNYIKDFGAASYVPALNEIFAGVSDLDLGKLMLANLGLGSVFTEAQAASFLAANASNRVGAVLNLASGLSSYTGTNAAILSAKTAFNNKLDFAIDYTQSNADASNFPSTFDFSTFVLSTAQDLMVGTSGADLFQAYLNNNSNTFNTGDKIEGGAGADTLYADLLNTGVAQTAISSGVETVQFRAQNVTTDATDNNMALTDESAVDAQRMKDVTWWESNNSRADLVIEDVRINANQITKDITIAMVETDPGHVDYGVYFDQLSLRNASATTSTLALELLDTRSQAAGTGPLKDNPYNGFGFLLNGNAVVVQAEGIDNALTYADLRSAIEGRINELKVTNPALANFTVSLGATFSRFDTNTGTLVNGTTIVLTDTGGGAITLNPNVGWVTATGTVPPSSGLHTNISNAASSTTELVTSKIVLDDVGRGSTGGDLVVGGLSAGDTSTSKGVQRFEIEVRDNSKLQTINSTNNTLLEVTLKNGATTSVTNAYTTTVTNSGYLEVNGTVNNLDGGVSTNDMNVALPGSHNQHNAFGFSDVRLIDGSAMTGKLGFTAEITQASIAKYLNLKDTQSAPGADNIAFVYTGGSSDDTMSVTIDGAVVGSTGTLGAREDFTFTANGGAGNDRITLDMDNSTSANWYQDQKIVKNVTINGGDGNDTIRKPGFGDLTINAGAGNDVVYSDNSGLSAAAVATWVVSEANAVPVLTDLLGVAANNTEIFLYKGKLTVTFSGDTATAGGGVTDTPAVHNVNGWEVAVDIPTGTNFAVNQYYLNQAIKAAINSDAVLKTLLVAEDGPANTLTIKSLIDGAFTNTDLRMTVTAAAATSYAAGEQASILTAYKAFSHISTSVIGDVDTAIAASVTNLNNNEGMDTTPVLVTTGAISVAESDNKIDLGSGTQDVLVLGTGVLSNETVVFTNYDLGRKTIVNFEDGTLTATALDKFDFTSYLNNKQSLSGSVDSATRIATTLNADASVDANSVTVLTGFNFNTTTTDTFAGLTAAKLLAAINSTNTGAATYAGIANATLDAQVGYTTSGAPTTLVGGIGKGVVLIQNDDNLGEYMAFELTWNGAAAAGPTQLDFTAAQLIGVIDLGATTTFAVGAAGTLV